MTRLACGRDLLLVLKRQVSAWSIHIQKVLEEALGLIQGFIRIVPHQKNMTHFASRHGLCFTIEMKLDLRMSQEAFPLRRSISP